MDIKELIKNFANLLDDTEVSEIQAETNFRELEEWSSMVSLALLNMIDKKYGVKIAFNDMRTLSTIQQLFNFVVKELDAK